ncbi:hypothetical protein D9M68_922260 [compost metagenome]
MPTCEVLGYQTIHRIVGEAVHFGRTNLLTGPIADGIIAIVCRLGFRIVLASQESPTVIGIGPSQVSLFECCHPSKIIATDCGSNSSRLFNSLQQTLIWVTIRGITTLRGVSILIYQRLEIISPV